MSIFLQMTSLLSYSFSFILSCSLIPNAVAYSGRCSRFRGRRWIDVARAGLRSSLLRVSIVLFVFIVAIFNHLANISHVVPHDMQQLIIMIRSWWPMFTIVFYVLSPLPLMIARHYQVNHFTAHPCYKQKSNHSSFSQ